MENVKLSESAKEFLNEKVQECVKILASTMSAIEVENYIMGKFVDDKNGYEYELQFTKKKIS